MFKTPVVQADLVKNSQETPRPNNECRVTKATAEEMDTILREKYGDKFKQKNNMHKKSSRV